MTRAFAAAALVLVATACKHAAPAVEEEHGGAGDPPPARAADVVGYWSGDWGRLILRSDHLRVIGVYDHDDGTLQGDMVDGVLVGWWCEAPSRKGPKDGGDVELRFVTGSAPTIDGRWRYGTDGGWHDDWDLHFDAGEPPPELAARLYDKAQFCEHPGTLKPAEELFE